MKDYKIRRRVYKDGELIADTTLNVYSYTLEAETRKVGREGLLELVNKWNEIGTLGFEKSGIVYVYTAL